MYRCQDERNIGAIVHIPLSASHLFLKIFLILIEKYEKLKVRLDDYENTATNDEPLIKLKKACADLKVTLLFLFKKFDRVK